MKAYEPHSAPLPTWGLWQPVLNEHWPAGKAWRIPRAAEPIPVRVRIVWRTDGECWLEGLATRWTATAVQVELVDRRLGPLATWVAPSDVRRRDGPDIVTMR